MRVAILESIIMPAGHEVEFDRILVDELKRQGHILCFFVPKNFTFKIDYKTDIEYLTGGEVVTYAGASKIKITGTGEFFSLLFRTVLKYLYVAVGIIIASHNP